MNDWLNGSVLVAEARHLIGITPTSQDAEQRAWILQMLEDRARLLDRIQDDDETVILKPHHGHSRWKHAADQYRALADALRAAGEP